MQTNHLILDIARVEMYGCQFVDKVRVMNNMEISTNKDGVTFRNETTVVFLFRKGYQILATINGLGPLLVDKFHVSYDSYPIVRRALR